MNTITIKGLKNMDYPETRVLLLLDVIYNGNKYGWQIFCPEGINHNDFLTEEVKQKIYDNIQTKEDEWANLDPKTRVIPGMFGEDDIIVDIQKEEIVRPDIPDYYAKRRSEYPSIGDQLDAFWKGSESQDYIDMVNKIQSIKTKYPK